MKQISERLYILYDYSDVYSFSSIKNIKNNDLVIIIPGMLDKDSSDSEYMLIANAALELSKNTNWNVAILHNQSHGFFSDLGESISGKLLGWFSRILEDPIEYPGRLLKTLLAYRPDRQKTVILCHSQGGIITSNALNCCNDINLENIRVEFFGAANWFLPHINKSQMAVYANKFDLVAYLFGRGFFRSTVRLKSSLHGITHYQPAMELVLKHDFSVISDKQFNEDINNV